MFHAVAMPSQMWMWLQQLYATQMVSNISQRGGGGWRTGTVFSDVHSPQLQPQPVLQKRSSFRRFRCMSMDSQVHVGYGVRVHDAQGS